MSGKYKDSKLKYINKYNKEAYRSILLHISRKNEADMIEHLLAQPSINSYIKSLIRDDMNRAK